MRRNELPIAVLSVLLGVSGCAGGVVVDVREPAPSHVVVVDDGGPWLVASSGRREGMHRYRYYERDQVYYDLDARMYYYQDNYSGPWLTVSTLPSYVVLENSYAVDLDMRAPQPYGHHEEVVRKYPPGQAKKGRMGRHNRGDGDQWNENRGRGK